jgi:hypothetical protein
MNLIFTMDRFEVWRPETPQNTRAKQALDSQSTSLWQLLIIMRHFRVLGLPVDVVIRH